MGAFLIRAFFTALAFLAAMWAGSLWIYDDERMNDALEWRWAELNDEPLYAWPFNDSSEITHGHGLGEFTWSEGTLSGDYRDPYFYLNLEGRYIDARRFTELRLRLRSENRNALRLFHFQLRKDRIHASELVPVPPGWQTLRLALPELKWHVKNLADPDGPVLDSSWGGEKGVVTALRIDPVEEGAFAVDWIELDDPGERPTPVDEVDTFGNLDDELFDRMRREPDRSWHIAHDNWLRTPETAHWMRQNIAEVFPSAIVFPHPPNAEQLAYPPFQAGALSAFIPASFFIAALLILVVRDQIPLPWRWVVAVIALVTLIEAYVYWLPSLSITWRVLLAIPLLGALWELAPKEVPRYVVGQPRAWLLVSPFLLVSVLVFLLAPHQGFEEYSVPEALGRYFLWALFQQFVIAVLIQERLKPVFGRLGIVVSAGIFGLFHFPNFALMAATFLLGIALLNIYQRHQNLLAIAAAQAFLAVSFNTLALQYLWLSRTIGPAFSQAL